MPIFLNILITTALARLNAEIRVENIKIFMNYKHVNKTRILEKGQMKRIYRCIFENESKR